jgi:hypothetical protein
LTKKAKETKIKEKIDELVSIFSNLSEDTQRTVRPLIDKAAFMSVTLDDLQDEININGVIEQYQNGANQFGVKKSAAVDVYNTMIKNYTSIMKQITELLPKEEPLTKAGDSLKAFINE